MQKQAVNINFSNGIDTKTDPWQLQIGQFAELNNSVFTKQGMLQKRNGNISLPPLSSDFTYLTTFNDNLTAVGSSISALNTGGASWVSKGSIAPLNLKTMTLIRNSVNQLQCDAVVSPNGLVCTVYTENNNSTNTYKYAIADAETGQNIVSPTLIPVSSGTVTGSPRVFMLGNLFVIVFTNVITATSHLQYIAISCYNPSVHTTNQDIAASYISATTVSWDGIVSGTNLYLAYNTTSGGQSVKVTYLTAATAAGGGAPVSAVTFAAEIATMMSLCADETTSTPVIYVVYFNSAGPLARVLAVSPILATVLAPTTWSTADIANITSAAFAGFVQIYSEVNNNYSYDSSIPSHFTRRLPVSQAGVLGTSITFARSVGLASKAFIVDGDDYVLTTYRSPYQSTYFLINGAISNVGEPHVVAKLCYQTSRGYLTTGLPNVTVNGLTAKLSYSINQFVGAENTVSAAPVAGEILGVYSQTGINLASVTFQTPISSSEIASNLHFSGGFLWQYDGYLPVENNFFLYPDSVESTTATTGGFLADQTYFYAATYEWEDNQGNVSRSAASIPIRQVTTGGGTSANTINVPYLRITYKIQNPPKIVIYRWSTAQPIFYRITSRSSVQVNTALSDSLAFVDTLADSSIIGNDILYTTGGVVENINGPAFDNVFLFDDRLWGITSEDKNLMWFSKQVLEGTPVEMSDLLTYYAAPSAGAQGPTGVIKCGAAMDDKLVLFKASAMSYINGSGPDNTGANNGYSPSPVFITSTVGCSNQRSIVFQPQGLMFEFASEAGNQIWILGRDLSTKYIGAPVEALTQSATVQSAVNIPGTNQVRFTLSSGITIMYDYYYSQWGTFTGVPAISSCVYQGVQSFINSSGEVFKESPGTYLDGSNPVLLSFTTGWLNLAALQGYQRFYDVYFLARYLSPHFLQVQVSYDYNDSPLHQKIISPDNFSSSNPSSFGVPVPFGAPVDREQWKIDAKKQLCQSFKLKFTEVFDHEMGAVAGAGFTVSGFTVNVGIKKSTRPIRGANTAGMS